MKLFDEKDLPTISLCIPARNETHSLEECLVNVTESDYPKLEIIVLDDCSQDKTSYIIKAFANKGVRFVQGKVPSDGWLGKNNAYRALASEAHGSYLVFMSVDTRIEKDTLSHLVGYMQLKKLSMVSVLPKRTDGIRLSAIFSPLRYFWQVVTPVWMSTPAATSLWMIRREQLEEVGGFDALKNNILPENFLARLFASSHRYSFLVANQQFSVHYAKKWSSQIDTGIRLWYPLLGKKLSKIIIMILLHVCLFILPYIIFLYSALIIQSSIGSAISLGVIFFISMIYWRYAYQVQKSTWLVAPFVLPFLGFQEIIIIIRSYLQYKQGNVDWKGRNVCYPAPHREMQ